MIRRAEDAMLAGMLTSFRRMLALVTLASPTPATIAAARVRLNAMTARTNHAALAVDTPDGRCAKALFFRSALTCSMTA